MKNIAQQDRKNALPGSLQVNLIIEKMLMSGSYKITNASGWALDYSSGCCPNSPDAYANVGRGQISGYKLYMYTFLIANRSKSLAKAETLDSARLKSAQRMVTPTHHAVPPTTGVVVWSSVQSSF